MYGDNGPSLSKGDSGGAASDASEGRGGSASAVGGQMSTHVQDLLSDIESRPWMTYRENFPPILDSKYTSDVGWGCMIRSAQMMLAQTLFVARLGRDFRVGGGSSGPFTKDPRHRQLLTLFADLPSERCPFSVHNLLRHAAEDRVRPGSWLGPSIACRALCRAVNQEQREMLQLRVYLALDCLVSKERVQETILSSGKAWVPILVLIPLR